MISELHQTPKDMVFSQTSLKTQSTLKVVEIDRLKPGKSRQVNGSTGVTTSEHIIASMPPPPVATTSYSEVYLKSEPIFESTMYHDTDYEFFQDLGPLCSDLAKEELVQTTDSPKKTEESVHNTDTLHTPFSPTGWEGFDANNSPVQNGYYVSTPNDPLSPNMDSFGQLESKFLYNNEQKVEQELNFDLSTLPVVVEQLASEQSVGLNSAYIADPVDYNSTHYTLNTMNTENKLLYFNLDEFDMKLDVVKPTEIENTVDRSEYITDIGWTTEPTIDIPQVERRGMGLTLNVSAPAPWPGFDITTPDVVNAVEQLEKQELPLMDLKASVTSIQDSGFLSNDTTNISVPSVDYEPMTPKTESHLGSDVEEVNQSTKSRRRHRESEDSDYTPYEQPRGKRRKRNIPIKELINALEESQTQPKRRGRPPKRRESTVSSICSVDDNTSIVSTQESKYRDLRDKNNEASKRSRMNRKLKELQMEQLVTDLEERNKKLQVRSDILEDMTKRLKEALMTAILKK